MNSQQVISLLLDEEILEPSQADDLLQEAILNGKSIEELLIEGGYIDERRFYQVIAEALGMDFIELSESEIAPEVPPLVPASLARVHQALPIAAHGNTITVALADPFNLSVAEDLRFALGKEVNIVVARVQQVEEQISHYYGSDSPRMEEILEQLEQNQKRPGRGEDEGHSGLEAEANTMPIIRFVDLILFQGIKDHASDIHFEPFENEFKIRYRVDGTLHEMAPPPRHIALPVISRLKVMANMNIAERRLPQDGRIKKNIAGRTVDLRVSTLPTQFGESVVLRVLDRSTMNLELESLGLPERIHGYLLELIHRSSGIFIVSGPTGSGKTTTLYSCLKKINKLDSKLLTVEEPVEYDLDGVIQVPVNDAIGLTFARALRAFLRQDPDRIMVGETRDLETAQISIQASLTGHLVFTTLHTNDTPGAITRLVDLGVEPFLVSSTLEAVLGQRLLRKICPHCRTPYQPTETLLARFGLSDRNIGENNFYYGKGCNACNQTGYKGRKGIYELLTITDPLRELINQRAPTVRLREKAIELGMVTLRQDGLQSIFAGDTTLEEVLRYTWDT
jgi:type IV pilus assembly protein PilB